ncbi:MAG: hypothetical protein E4H01_12660, partial [Lysobacterales bacterium]
MSADTPPGAAALLPYALAIFTGAFLLFLAQPLIAKYILPWFGGGPAVWTTCMLFFQVLLLGGYAYAHLSIRRFKPRVQALLHLALLLAALTQLPITPDDAWKPLSVDAPTWHVLVLLSASIGLPFLALASTTPLMQAWLNLSHPGVSPYRLFALSNFGSLLALLSYPLLIEPALTRTGQATVWVLGFGLFLVLSGYCAWRTWGRERADTTHSAAASSPRPNAPRVTPGTRLLWLALPACAVVLLLAVTNQITKDLVVVPFLWVLPLALYLLSFVISFADERGYCRWAYAVALVPAMAVAVVTMSRPMATPPLQQIGVYSMALFVGCMICHGELSRLKPHARHLTDYYLMVALGGALGGVFVTVGAPLIFSDYLELHLGLLGVCGLALITHFIDRKSALHGGHPLWAWALLITAYVGFGVALYFQVATPPGMVIAQSRNFYGVLKVVRRFEGSADEQRWLYHGATPHGVQFTSPEQRRLGTGYYSARSGAGLALRFFRQQRPRRIGLVGLGVGTLTAFGKENDVIRIYEIDPEIRRIAKTYFSYLADSPARIDMVMGDARLSLERESPQGFDLLLIDAFSGDAMPLHLLTREAFEVYLSHLEPNGVIGLLIDTDHLDFEPVLRRLADHFGLQAARIITPSGPGQDWGADWMLMTRNREFLDSQPIALATSQPSASVDHVRLWTDDYTSLL